MVKHEPPPMTEEPKNEMHAIPDGEANFFMLAPTRGEWCARVQFHGSLDHEMQQELAVLFARSINAEYGE